VLDAIALAAIFLVVAYGILRDTVLESDRPLLVLASAAIVAALGLVAIQVLRKRGALERAREFLRPMAGASRALLGRTGVILLAGSFLIWAAEGSVYLSVAHATGLDMSGLGALYLMAFTNLVAMVPAAPGYLGTFDAAVILGVRAIGGTRGAALPYLLLLRFVLFVPITLVGLLMLVTRYGGWSRLRAATRLEARSA
jgi:glycosyltransferase 2 family protein